MIILFSRVISKLGTLEHINPKVIESLFSADLAYLQDFYRRINENGAQPDRRDVPRMQRQLRAGGELRGGGLGYPLDQLFEEVAYIAYHFHWSASRSCGSSMETAASGSARSPRSTGGSTKKT